MLECRKWPKWYINTALAPLTWSVTLLLHIWFFYWHCCTTATWTTNPFLPARRFSLGYFLGFCVCKFNVWFLGKKHLQIISVSAIFSASRKILIILPFWGAIILKKRNKACFVKRIVNSIYYLPLVFRLIYHRNSFRGI